MLARIKDILENHESSVGKRVDLAIQILIVLSLVAFSIETLPDLDPSTREYLQFFEVFSVAVFTVEYVLRLIVAEQKLRFVFSFFGIIDLLAILPFYIAEEVDLRSARVFRLLRLFRAFKLLRYSNTLVRFQRAIMIAKEELILFMFVTCLLLYLAAVGIYHFEHEAQPKVFASIFDSLWWAVATLTTVGYGDAYPITAGGRLFTFFLLLVGLGIVAVPAGLVASALSKAREHDEPELGETRTNAGDSQHET